MLSIYDNQTAAAVLGGNLNTDLRALIEAHLVTAKENGLSAMTHIAVIEEGDTEATIIEELGFSPLHNPLTGKRFGDQGFRPHWDWLEVYSDWYEMLYCVGDSGFAFILLIEETPSATSELLNLCRQYSSV